MNQPDLKLQSPISELDGQLTSQMASLVARIEDILRDVYDNINSLTDDTPFELGTGAPAEMVWSTKDANAHCVKLILPEGGGTTDVPVFIIGDKTIKNLDIDKYAGANVPVLVVMSDGATKRLSFRHDGTNAEFFSSSGDIVLFPVGNAVKPNADNDVDLGTSSKNWKDIRFKGSIYANGNQSASGSFTTVDGKTVTVVNGIITAIV